MEELDRIELQRRHGGRYVALRGREVVLSAATFDELADWLERGDVRLNGIIVEYVVPPDVIVIF